VVAEGDAIRVTGNTLLARLARAWRFALDPGGVQFVIGSMLEGEQGIVGVRYGPQDLVELALRRDRAGMQGTKLREQTAKDAIRPRCPTGLRGPDGREGPCRRGIDETQGSGGGDPDDARDRQGRHPGPSDRTG
jgi:hypothetical protein